MGSRGVIERCAGRGGLIVVVAAVALLVGCTTAEPGGAADADRRTTSAPDTTSAPSPAEDTENADDPEPPAAASSSPMPSGADDLPEGRDLVVTSITDGDTFRIGDERVRLIGVDTPEVSGGVECFGREATDALDQLIPPGTEVRLVADVEPFDRYDRTLAYVYRLSDGAFVNLALAQDGFALPLTIPPNVAHEDAFASAAAEARDADRGPWSACEGDVGSGPAPSSTSAPPSAGPPGADGAGGCGPAYPGVCIPPSPPDLDCGDITERDFVVLPPDPHRFDRNGDGRGCER